MEIQVTVAGEGTFAIPFAIANSTNCVTPGGGTCESCTVVSGQFTTNTPAMAVPPYFVGGPSTCFPTKACPGADPNTNVPPAQFITHSFTNTTTRELCVTVQARTDCSPLTPLMQLGVSAYLGALDPDQLCAGYLGDGGDSGALLAPFAFRVPAGSNFVVVVVARTTLVCSNYTVELFGLPCAPPTLAVTPVAGVQAFGGSGALPAEVGSPATFQIDWSTAYPDFTLQQADQVTGPFSDLPQLPAVINGRYAETNMSPTMNQFYRLRKGP